MTNFVCYYTMFDLKNQALIAIIKQILTYFEVFMWYLALIAFVPIVFCVVVMAAFNWPAKYALPVSWLLACIFGFIFWDMDLLSLTAYSISGLLNSIDVLIIITGAILVMNTLKMSGAMATINNGFKSISPDGRIQTIIIGFLFVSFLEAAAGFGTPAALAAPLLASLGCPPLGAAVVALICDTAAVSFGAIGTPVITSINCLGPEIATQSFSMSLSFWSAVPHVAVSTFLPFVIVAVICKFFSKERSFRPAIQILPFSLLAGLSFSIPYLLVATFVGYEFPSIFGALIGLIVTVVAAKKGFLVPKTEWHFSDQTDWDESWKSSRKLVPMKPSNMSLLKAWIPYGLIAVLLVVSRLPVSVGGKTIAAWLKSDVISPSISSVFGVENTGYILKWAYIPGTMFIFVALLTILIHRMKGREVFSAFKETGKQVAGAAVAVVFGLALVQILRYSGSNDVNAEGTKSMIFYMAEALSGVGKSVYVMIAPVIGDLGAFVSGSNTVSNTLFTNLQYQSATNLGLRGDMIVAMQVVGGAVGNMICVNNVVAACATVATNGKEGKIIRMNLIPTLLYTAVVIGIFLIILWTGNMDAGTKIFT